MVLIAFGKCSRIKGRVENGTQQLTVYDDDSVMLFMLSSSTLKENIEAF
jgi:hypothetical protein